jgi:hypothetical protein
MAAHQRTRWLRATRYEHGPNDAIDPVFPAGILGTCSTNLKGSRHGLLEAYVYAAIASC